MSSPAAGAKILHYTIVRPIGSGGMGVVYEAEDAKLGRRVALKFLPATVARDRATIERFQREARAASALNHPNICTIYAIEESGGDCFIAIFVTRDGRAKVLDFGVAKVAVPRGGDAETVSVTAAESRLTGPGLAVGTIAYMSPEQARGDDLDGRSDLFSLAAVLYEMSTRQPAFDGKTSAVVFQKILDTTPEAPARVNPALPARLDEIIVKGLEKDRDLRYQTAEELRGDLKRLKRDASAGTLAVSSAAIAVASPRSSGALLAAEARRRKGLVGIVSLVALTTLAAACYGVYAMFLRAPAVAPATASSRIRIVPLTTSGDIRGCGSISPDGKYVAYCDFSGRLSVRQVATGSTVRLGDFEGATAFSADGNFVYVSTDGTEPNANGVLSVIPTLGGEARRVTSGISGPVGVSPDGKRIAFLRQFPVERKQLIITADAFGGNERTLATNTSNETWFEDVGVSWSHDGKRLSTAQATTVGGFRMRLVILDAETGKLDPLGDVTFDDVGRTAWLPGNRGLLFAAREAFGAKHQFWIARVPGGEATRITTDTRGVGNMSVSVTADGSTIATVPVQTVGHLWSTNADASAPLEQWTSGVQVDGDSGIAPQSDGRVHYTSEDGVDLGIWSIDAAGARPRKVTRQYAEDPTTPDDGRFVVFSGRHEDRFRVWRMQPDGSDARPLSNGEDDYGPRVSPDGRWIYYMMSTANTDRLVRMPAEDGASTPIGSEAARTSSRMSSARMASRISGSNRSPADRRAN